LPSSGARKGIMAEKVAVQTAEQARKFGFTVGVAFGVFGSIAAWRGHMPVASVMWVIGALLVLGGVLAPKALMPVERAWMAMAHAISKVTTPIVMGIVYFLVLFPIGFFIRRFKGNPLVRAGTDGSYWVSRASETAQRGSMDRQF